MTDLHPNVRILAHALGIECQQDRREPVFAPLVPEWARLEELHRAGKSSEVYAEIKRLRGRPR